MLSVLLLLLLGCSLPAPEPPPSPRRPTAAAPTPASPSAAAPTDGPGLAYVVYVRSFQDTDGDGVGDLDGVDMRLDYLVGLGVTDLVLLPITAGASPLGDDPTDLGSLCHAYGTLDDLSHLVVDAHDRGIRVILDLPIHATSDQHPDFLAALAEPSARDRYRFRDTPPPAHADGWFPAEDTWYEGSDDADHPTLEWADEEVVEGQTSALVGWAAEVDGLWLPRAGALREDGSGDVDVDATRTTRAELRSALFAAAPDVDVIVDGDARTVADAVSLLGVAGRPEANRYVDRPRAEALLGALTGEGTDLLDVLSAEAELGALSAAAIPLGDAYVPRLHERLPDPRARRALWVLHLLSPGLPVVYYGDELDLPDDRAGLGEDEAWRGPMPWDDTPSAGFTRATPWMAPDPSWVDGVNVSAELADPESTLAFVKALGELRARLLAARAGAWHADPTPDPALLGFGRESEEDALRIYVNRSPSALPGLEVEAPGAWVDLSRDGLGLDCAPTCPLGPIAPYGFRIWVRSDVALPDLPEVRRAGG